MSRAAAPGGQRSLERMRARLIVGAVLFAFGYAGIGVRLVDVTVLRADTEAAPAAAAAAVAPGPQRADIVDRNGRLLATTVPARALYADPRLIADADETALRLAAALPGLDPGAVARKLGSDRSFVWIRRTLRPREVHAVNGLGEPGLGFLPAERRLYPVSDLGAHAVGFTDVDNRGLAGIEARFDERLRASPSEPLALSIDLRFQHAVHDELARAMARFSATGAAAAVLAADSAEVLALVSLPSFDPHRAGADDGGARFNRATLGIFEMGSTFKAFTIALGLESGTVTLADGYDATEPLRISRFTIRDSHAQKRWLSVPEIFMHSSNIGAAKMALAVGAAAQREFLERLGLLSAASVELPEVGAPLAPPRWRNVNVATISFGHGVAVSPLQLAAAIAPLVNGGVWRPPTILAERGGGPREGRRVVSERTSRQMRQLFRLVVTHGTGKKAEAEGYRVGGKTGTAEKLTNGAYDRGRLMSSFVAAFPMDAPRFVVLVAIDEPKGIEETHGYATGGWTAAPTVGAIIARIGPMAGIAPQFPPPSDPEPGDGPGYRIAPDGSELRFASY